MDGGHAGGTTRTNMLSVPSLDPVGVGGRHCLPHSERQVENQEYYNIFQRTIKMEIETKEETN